MLDTLAVLRVLLAASPNMTLSQAFGLVSDLNGCISTQEVTLIDFARNLSTVMNELRDGRKIQAIKNLRDAGRNDPRFGIVGLKEAKDACDALCVEIFGTMYPPRY